MNDIVNQVARASYEAWRKRTPAAKLTWNDIVLSSAHPTAKALLAGLREDARAILAVLRPHFAAFDFTPTAALADDALCTVSVKAGDLRKLRALLGEPS